MASESSAETFATGHPGEQFEFETLEDAAGLFENPTLSGELIKSDDDLLLRLVLSLIRFFSFLVC